MKIEFYINDKTDINHYIQHLAISITLKHLHTIYIDNKEYDLDKVRRKIFRKGLIDIYSQLCDKCLGELKNEL
jgi:hypothetical protein